MGFNPPGILLSALIKPQRWMWALIPREWAFPAPISSLWISTGEIQPEQIPRDLNVLWGKSEPTNQNQPVTLTGKSGETWNSREKNLAVFSWKAAQKQLNGVVGTPLSIPLTPHLPFLPATPYPRGFKCFTCEKASDNYECNRWAPDVYCPRGNQGCSPPPDPARLSPLVPKKMWNLGFWS